MVGIYDPLVFRSLNYSIRSNNRFFNTKKFTDFVTDSKGAQEAVAEAVLHVLEKFFEKKTFSIFKLISQLLGNK